MYLVASVRLSVGHHSHGWTVWPTENTQPSWTKNRQEGDRNQGCRLNGPTRRARTDTQTDRHYQVHCVPASRSINYFKLPYYTCQLSMGSGHCTWGGCTDRIICNTHGEVSHSNSSAFLGLLTFKWTTHRKYLWIPGCLISFYDHNTSSTSFEMARLPSNLQKCQVEAFPWYITLAMRKYFCLDV